MAAVTTILVLAIATPGAYSAVVTASVSRSRWAEAAAAGPVQVRNCPQLLAHEGITELRVTASALNLRKNANTSSQVLDVIDNGTVIECTQKL